MPFTATVASRRDAMKPWRSVRTAKSLLSFCAIVAAPAMGFLLHVCTAEHAALPTAGDPRFETACAKELAPLLASQQQSIDALASQVGECMGHLLHRPGQTGGSAKYPTSSDVDADASGSSKLDHAGAPDVLDTPLKLRVTGDGRQADVQPPSWTPVRYRVDSSVVHGGPERLYYLPEALSPSDCDYLLRHASSKWEDSALFGTKDGRPTPDEEGQASSSPQDLNDSGDSKGGVDALVRKSRSAFISRSEEADDPRLKAIKERLFVLAGAPDAHCEDFQVTEYPPGGKYELHYDSSMSVGRLMTVLVYLDDVEEGGETVFPRARLDKSAKLPKLHNRHGKHPPIQQFCDSPAVLKFKPKRGAAVLWFNHGMDLSLDYKTLHGSCPLPESTASGGIPPTKHIAQLWIRWWLRDDGNQFFNVLQECNVL